MAEEIYRTYIGPFYRGKVELTYHKGEITRGQRIRVTEKEAAAMDKLPKQWRREHHEVFGYLVPQTEAIETQITVTKKAKAVTKTKRRKPRKRKGGK